MSAIFCLVWFSFRNFASFEKKLKGVSIVHARYWFVATRGPRKGKREQQQLASMEKQQHKSSWRKTQEWRLLRWKKADHWPLILGVTGFAYLFLYFSHSFFRSLFLFLFFFSFFFFLSLSPFFFLSLSFFLPFFLFSFYLLW